MIGPVATRETEKAVFAEIAKLPHDGRFVAKDLTGFEGRDRAPVSAWAPKKYLTLAHAECVAWRIVYDWTRAQLALIEAGAADLGEVFLPYLLVGPGETVYGKFLAGGGHLALTAGEAVP